MATPAPEQKQIAIDLDSKEFPFGGGYGFVQSAEAISKLADNFFEGKNGMPQNLQQAFHYRQLAVYAFCTGNSEPSNQQIELKKLGECYLNGKGVEKNIDMAVKCFLWAARLNRKWSKWSLSGDYRYQHQDDLDLDEKEPEESLRKLIEVHPIAKKAFYKLAAHYYDVGHPDRASQLWFELVKLGEKDAFIFLKSRATDADAQNKIIRYCLAGKGLAEKAEEKDTSAVFLRAINSRTLDKDNHATLHTLANTESEFQQKYCYCYARSLFRIGEQKMIFTALNYYWLALKKYDNNIMNRMDAELLAIKKEIYDEKHRDLIDATLAVVSTYKKDFNQTYTCLASLRPEKLTAEQNFLIGKLIFCHLASLQENSGKYIRESRRKILEMSLGHLLAVAKLDENKFPAQKPSIDAAREMVENIFFTIAKSNIPLKNAFSPASTLTCSQCLDLIHPDMLNDYLEKRIDLTNEQLAAHLKTPEIERVKDQDPMASPQSTFFHAPAGADKKEAKLTEPPASQSASRLSALEISSR